MSTMPAVSMFTDGATLGSNPGRAGYAAIWMREYGEGEVSGGFRRSTNNRMELFAAIAGLEDLEMPSRVAIYSDAEYLVNAVEENWIGRWQLHGWLTRAGKAVKNQDLWLRLIAAMARHRVTFKWVRGHAGHLMNEAADRLANEAANGAGLPDDEGFEAAR